MNAKSFYIKWAIVDGYKVIRKIHNDAKKSFEKAVYSENLRVSEVDFIFSRTWSHLLFAQIHGIS